MKISDRKIKAYALKNAVAHDGVAMTGPVLSSLFNEGLKKEDMKTYGKKINEIILDVNKLSAEEQKKEFEKVKEDVSERETREGLPELPNAEKGVVMRFRPAPSGPMHLGHALTGMPTSLYAKKYGGKFYVVIDDTNPKKVFADCYKTFKEDGNWLFGNVTKYVTPSDRIKTYYEYAEKLINKKSAYVCTCSQEVFKKFSEEKKDCPCRDLKTKAQLERWNEMLNEDGFEEGSAVLRFKSDMNAPNPAMRDFPLARINLTEHPKQGKKYRVWPLMNLSVAVDDIEDGMTHIIRAKEHMDNAKRQEMIFKVLGKKFPWTFFMGRYKFTDVPLSKRKIVAAIEAGEFSGWEDEKLPTLAVLRKKGYKPSAFAKFAEHRGLSEVDKVIDSKEIFRLLDEFNE